MIYVSNLHSVTYVSNLHLSNLQEHCVIESTASALTLSPVSSAVCFVNGRQLDPGSNEVLAHNDRLILGGFGGFLGPSRRRADARAPRPEVVYERTCSRNFRVTLMFKLRL